MYDLYREHILDHYQNPRNYGEMEDPDISHEEYNPLCGDRLVIQLKLDGDRVADVKFHGEGCAISQASASMLTEVVEGKTLDELKTLTKEDILDMLGIPIGPVRIKCALLSLKALKAGVYGIPDWDFEEEEL
ncbi:MAG: SUF system NifU family Fe-S cluster assembly protein [Chloroflexi bacterium]|nr:MAG: SUF system NifU family Fe-S cluster assembly protein [Chloroflexota bacterium]